MKLPKTPICRKEIRQNIFNVKNDLPLTQPLSALNFYCEFRKEWEESFDVEHKDQIADEKIRMRREYRDKPGVKARARKYDRSPGRKIKQRENGKRYRNKPGVKARYNRLARERYARRKANAIS